MSDEFKLTGAQLEKAARLLAEEDDQLPDPAIYNNIERVAILQPYREEVLRFITIARCISKVLEDEA